ncbi:MAG: 50S ribosomal protein L33 2 [Tenericutes bacterium ADurb.Bin087]|nr:MAG: 50S ribosomal protein L33 2 [Tenericutes bacterium ADurb.Bin087]
MRVSIQLRCTECNEENYLSSKNKKNNPERIEKMKFCPRCNKQTLHREKR